MPVHEARRAMLYGDATDYDPNSSVFIIVFEIQRADPLEHFSRPLAFGQKDLTLRVNRL